MTTRAYVRRVGKRWSVRVDRNHAKVDELGDAKRTGEALAQVPLKWERKNDREWHGREFTTDEFNRNARIYLSDVE